MAIQQQNSTSTAPPPISEQSIGESPQGSAASDRIPSESTPTSVAAGGDDDVIDSNSNIGDASSCKELGFLIDAGFDRSSALWALRHSNNDVSRAMELLLQYQVQDQRQLSVVEPAPAPAPAPAVSQHDRGGSGIGSGGIGDPAQRMAVQGNNYDESNIYNDDDDSSGENDDDGEAVDNDGDVDMVAVDPMQPLHYDRKHSNKRRPFASTQEAVAAHDTNPESRAQMVPENPERALVPVSAAYPAVSAAYPAVSAAYPAVSAAYPASTLGRSGGRSIEEQQLEEAIALSLREQEEQQQKKRKIQSTSGTAYQDDLNQAITLSLQLQHQHRTQEDARKVALPDLLREQKDMPVGLLNVGNTCYVNSILQSYFFIPRFRKFVLSYGKDCEQQQQCIDPFMIELQRLFGYMLLSDRKFVDPLPLVEAMHRDGMLVKIGIQEDLLEINDMFMSKLERVVASRDAPATQLSSEAAHSGSDEMEIDSPKSHHQDTHGEQCTAFEMRQQPPLVTKELFYGRSVELLEARKQDGTLVQMRNHEDYCSLIVNVSTELNSLYSSLDQYTSTETVDYRTDIETEALKSTWLETVPPVLFIQVQRTAFDQTSKQANKVDCAFRFPKFLSVDRFLEKNKDETITRRQRAREIYQRIDELKHQIEQIQNFDSRGVGIDEMFSMCARFMEINGHSLAQLTTQSEAPQRGPRQSSGSGNANTGIRPANSRSEATSSCGDNPHLRNIIKLLKQCEMAISSRSTALQEEIDHLSTTVEKIFDDMNSHRHVIHSVLVHEGSVDSGHYWCYYNRSWDDPSIMETSDEMAKMQWVKFNDSQVTECSEEEVWQNSMGGQSSTSSAYCLIYVDRDAVNVDGVNNNSIKCWTDLMPSHLRQEVENSNRQLHDNIIEFNERQKRKRIEQKQRFIQEYKQAVESALCAAEQPVYSSHSILKDERISSFPAFLINVEEIEAMKMATAEEQFKHIYELEHFSVYDELCLPPDEMSETFNVFLQVLAESDSDMPVDPRSLQSHIPSKRKMDELRDMYNKFIDCSRFYAAGLSFIKGKEWEIAAEALQIALSLDSLLPDTVKRRKDIVSYLALCIDSFFNNAQQAMFKTNNFQVGVFYMRSALQTIQHIIMDHTLAFVVDLRSKFLQGADQYLHRKTTSEEEKRTVMELVSKFNDIHTDDLLASPPPPPQEQVDTSSSFSFDLDRIPTDRKLLQDFIQSHIHDVEMLHNRFFSKLDPSHSTSGSLTSFSSHNSFAPLSNNYYA